MKSLPNESRVMRLMPLLVVLGASCGGPDAQQDDPPAPLFSCATETRADAYVPGLRRTSASEAFEAVLVESNPGPPIKGPNTWTVQILDAHGVPQDGLGMTASPLMPDHTHPATVKPIVTPANDGTGMYTLDPVYLFMAGYWEVTLMLQPANGPKDKVVFKVCIPG